MKSVIERALVLICISAIQALAALDDGIYLLKEGPDKSPVRLPGGAGGGIDRKLDQSEYTVSAVSLVNSNERFSVRIANKLPPTPSNVRHLGIALNGTLYTIIGGSSENLESLTIRPVSFPLDRSVAERIAAFGGRAPILRKHIGHQIDLSFTTERDSYRNNEEVLVSVRLKNLGAAPITVGVEYQVGSYRSSQLLIVPFEESVPNLSDVRSLTTRTSSRGKETIKSGDTTLLREEVLQRWYKPTKPGWQYFTGLYTVRIFEHEDDENPCWIEQLGGDFGSQFSKK